jgi:hypothetical protein
MLSRVLLGAFVAIGAWWAVDLALRGRTGEAVLLGLWFVAAVAAMACLFWRPAVLVDGEGVELRNVVRDVRVPWAALDDVTTRYALTLHAGGSSHQSWAGAAPGRGTGARRLPDARWNPGGANPGTPSRDLRADSGATAFMVEQGWRSWRERQGGGGAGSRTVEPPSVEVTWRPLLPAIAVVAALVAAALTPVLS